MGKDYHKECTGEAAKTAHRHAKSGSEITLFGACFCPFVHRVWMALEHLGIAYTYVEVDPYAKPAELLAVSPRGLVPALRLTGSLSPLANGKAVGLSESTVILAFLEDLQSLRGAGAKRESSLLGSVTETYTRAQARALGEQFNKECVPRFYAYLQAQEADQQVAKGKEFKDALGQFTQRLGSVPGASQEDTWATGGDFGWVECIAAPWLYRARLVLSHYRGFAEPQDERYQRWVDAMFEHPAFVATTSDDELYLDSYARYAENRPKTSQVADAINNGTPLP